MRWFRSHRYVKRIYAALMISSLVCQLQVIVVSTVALSRPYEKEQSVEAFMRRYFDLEWIAVRLNFFVGVLSFVTAIGLRAWFLLRRLFFPRPVAGRIDGVDGVAVAADARAISQRRQTIACPVVAKITLYTVISGSLTALAFVRSNEDCGGDLNDAFFKLPFVSSVLAETESRRWRSGNRPTQRRYLYARAMAKRARQNSMFAVAGLSVAFTWGYLLWSVPHIVGYMSSH